MNIPGIINKCLWISCFLILPLLRYVFSTCSLPTASRSPLLEGGRTKNDILIYPEIVSSVSLITALYDSTAPHRFAEPPELRGACLLTDFLICLWYVLPISLICAGCDPPLPASFAALGQRQKISIKTGISNPPVYNPHKKVVGASAPAPSLIPNPQFPIPSCYTVFSPSPVYNPHTYSCRISGTPSRIPKSPVRNPFYPRLHTFPIHTRAASAAHLPAPRIPHPAPRTPILPACVQSP